MADVRIERISIRNFRGIADVDIPLTKKNLLFYGENGSGKSSFIDAIEYLLTGEIERFSRRDVKKDESIPFLKRTLPDSTVRIECLCSGITGLPVHISFPATKYTADHVLNTWMEQLIAYPPILRRSQIVGFIEEKGADRLKRLSQIIGLEQVDKTKLVWEAEKRSRQNALKNAKAAFEGVQLRMRDMTTGLQGASNFERISNRLSDAELSPVTNFTDIQNRKNELSRQVSSTEIGQHFQIANQVKEQLEELDRRLDVLLNTYAQEFYPDWQAYAQQKVNLQNELLRQFLTQGQEILSAIQNNDLCPFCEQPIEQSSVELRVQMRLESLDAARALTERVEIKRKSIHSQVNGCLALIRQMLGADLNIHADRVFLDTLNRTLVDLSDQGGENLVTVVYQATEIFAEALSDGQGASGEFRRALNTHLANLGARIGNTTLAETLTWLGSVEECLLNLEAAKVKMASAEIASRHAEKMFEALLQAREQHLTSINTEIAADFNSFYQRLHPDEGYGDIQLIFESAGKGVGITANYHGTSSHPLGFYSEGHLDTLGIAVFLAYIRRFSNAKLLILDDIMSTIDGAHRLRLAHLLDEEFGDYQIILTTHDRLWTEELQRTLKKLQTIQLSWTISDGVKIHELLEENWDHYVQLASTSPHDAVLRCARDFEKFLNTMRFNFALAIPAKYGDQYSIGEMNEKFFEWIEKKKIDHPDPNYEAKWRKLRQWLQTHIVLRNMAGAHYNEWAMTLNSGEAKDFVVLIKDLTSLFKCPSCQRNWVQYSTETKIVHCKYCSDKRNPDAPLWKTRG
jgi:ABC-type Mn2+/Zn2+ transport system ATPase subunit